MNLNPGVFSLLIAGALLQGYQGNAQKLTYPVTPKVTQVDNYFGTEVRDPYRWLENDTSANTKAWVRSEQKFTNDYLSKIPYRDKIRSRLKEISNYDKYASVAKIGDYIIYTKSDGVKNQVVYYIQKGISGTPEVLLDPNALAKDGSVSVGINGFSNDKKYMVYHTNKGGSDWQTFLVMDLATHQQLPDQINWVKNSGASWKGNGFYYAAYDQPAPGTELTAKAEYHKVYYHKLGDPQANDQLIYADKTKARMFYSAQMTKDEHYLFLYKSDGGDGSQVWFKDLKAGQKDFKLLFNDFTREFSVINNLNHKLLVYTNVGADNYRVISVDLLHPEKRNWKNIIPEKAEKLEGAETAGGKLFVKYLKDASTKSFQYNFDGKLDHEIKLPAIGTASLISGFADDTQALYNFASFTSAPSVFRYNIKTGESTVFKKAASRINTDDYSTEQVFYPSKDGTKIPMFIIHKKGIKLDGSHPTLLYAYGGFNISTTPGFSTASYILLENDGVYAVANIRGGGEYGEKWHSAGKLLNKQNCFDDFVAAGDYLISKGYTTKQKLAINGGSNGGLLVGAVMTQHPGFCQVALPEVGVMDMLRFQKFTVGWA